MIAIVQFLSFDSDLAFVAAIPQRPVMNLDDLLYHYLGADPDNLDEAAIAAAGERMAIDFGVERDSGRRFALWTLMHGLGVAPDPERAFKDVRERAAAYAYAKIARSADN